MHEDESNLRKPVNALLRAMSWSYDRATSAMPGFDSAVELAETHLRNSKGDRDKAIRNLTRWHVAYAGSIGFVTNAGGLITLPVAISTNLATTLFIQLRLIAAIAHLRGHCVKDDHVRTMAFMSLTGSGLANIAQEFGVKFGNRVSARLVQKVSGAALTKINQAVGFRLITKAGSTGLVNLSRVVPIVGGVVGGGFDAAMTRIVAEAAKEVFEPIHDNEPAPQPEQITTSK